MKDEELLVGEVMKTDVVVVKESTTLRQLIEMFSKYTFHTFPVVRDEDTLVGIVGLEEILNIFAPSPLANPHLRNMLRRSFLFDDEFADLNLIDADIPPEMGILCVVKDLMNANVITVSPEVSTRKARSIMRLHEIRTIPVQHEGHVVGVISLFDIIVAVFRKKRIIP